MWNTKEQLTKHRYASELLITEKGECLQQRKQFWNGCNSRLQNIVSRVEKDALSGQVLLAYQYRESTLKRKDCVTYGCKL